MDSVREQPTDGKPASGVRTLDRAVALVEAVVDAGPLALADLAGATGLARPTVHRLAVALEQHGVLRRDDAGRFAPGLALLGWGAAATRGLDLVEVVRPVLATLGTDTGESAQCFVRVGDRRVCVAAVERPSGLRDTVPLGASLPLDRGSAGIVLLAYADDADRFEVATARLVAVRAAGWAASLAEREPGVASVSAPVRDADGRVVAALGVSGPADRLGPEPARLADRVVAVATEAGRRMGASRAEDRREGRR